MAELPADIKLAIRQSVDEQNAAYRKERHGQRIFGLGVVALIFSLLSIGLYATFNDWLKRATEEIHAIAVADNIVRDKNFENVLITMISNATLSEELDLSNPLVFDWDQKTLERTGTPAVFDRIDKQMRWHDGDPISEQDGFCFLTGIKGDFNGGGERVRVYLHGSKPKRDWRFEGNSHVTGVGATVTCYKLK